MCCFIYLKHYLVSLIPKLNFNMCITAVCCPSVQQDKISLILFCRKYNIFTDLQDKLKSVWLDEISCYLSTFLMLKCSVRPLIPKNSKNGGNRYKESAINKHLLVSYFSEIQKNPSYWLLQHIKTFCFFMTSREWLLLMAMWLAWNMLTWLEVNGPHQLHERCCEKCFALRGANPTIFLSLPEWFSVPCRSFHIQRLMGCPCLQVARWRVTVAIRTSCTRRSWYTWLTRGTRRSPLPVPTILTIARFARLTCDHKTHFRTVVAQLKLLITVKRFWLL